MHNILTRDFYERDTALVAKEVLGKILVVKINNVEYNSKIVEVEAYYGEEDPASHARYGKTKRNYLMFGKAGVAYVYLIYGMYYCLNITTEKEGKAGAILIRGVEPLNKLENQYFKTDGPGKLCKTYNITTMDNGIDVCLKSSRIYLADNIEKENLEIGSSNRIGVSKDLDKHLRFYIKNNKFVSKGS